MEKRKLPINWEFTKEVSVEFKMDMCEDLINHYQSRVDHLKDEIKFNTDKYTKEAAAYAKECNNLIKNYYEDKIKYKQKEMQNYKVILANEYGGEQV